MYRTRAWVPGCLAGRSRGVPGRLPWALGRALGAPRERFPAQCLRPTYGHAPLGFASQIISMLMWKFCHLGSILGRSWESYWDHVAAFFIPSWSRTRLRTALSAKKLLFTKHYVFLWFLTKSGPQDGSEIVLGGVFRIEFSVRCLIVLVSVLVPFWSTQRVRHDFELENVNESLAQVVFVLVFVSFRGTQRCRDDFALKNVS